MRFWVLTAEKSREVYVLVGKTATVDPTKKMLMTQIEDGALAVGDRLLCFTAP